MTGSTAGIKPKCIRAIEMHERGISNDAIAERLGTTRRSIARMIHDGKEMRERLAAAREVAESV